MSISGEPSLVLELKPSGPPVGRGGKHWLRWAALIAVIAVVLCVGWVGGRHMGAYLYFRALRADVNWQKFDTTAEAGFAVNFRPAAHLVQDAHLDRLESLYYLKMVDLTLCEDITDRGVGVLARFPDLRELHLSRQVNFWDPNDKQYHGPALTDAGLAMLQGLKKLEILSIDGTGVTDAGLQALVGMSSLEVLDISHTQVTNAGLETLKSMKKLRFIRLDGSRVTCEGARSLQAALPDAQLMLENCKLDQNEGAGGNGE
jgi:Leucine rich repeat